MQPPCFCFCLVYMVAWVAFLLLGLVLRLLGCDLPLALHPSRQEALFGWTPGKHFCPYPTSGQARSPIWMDSIQTLLPIPYIRTGEKPYLDGLHSDTSARTLHPDRREALFGWTPFRHFCSDPTSGQTRSPIWMDSRQTLCLNSSIEFLSISQRMELLFNTGIYRYIRFGKIP